MSAIAIVATLNGIVVNIIMASRVMYGLSRQGNFPAPLGRINPRTQTPLVATGVAAAIVLAFALLLPIAELADLTARITLIMFALVNLALFIIKRRETAPPSHIFRCPIWVPVAGFLSCVAYVVADLAVAVLAPN
jgi:amino acid transporter